MCSVNAILRATIVQSARPTRQMESRTKQNLLHFDVFSRAFKGEWKFGGRVEARNSSDAKYQYMAENQIANPNNVAVYQKR